MTRRHLFFFPRISTHTFCNTHSPHPCLLVFLGILALRPVVCVLQRSVCFLYGQWHAQPLWGLTECEHCHMRLEPSVCWCVCLCVCVLVSWLVGRHQYRWGLQKWWVSWLGLLLSSWFTIKKSPDAAAQTDPSSPLATPRTLCLLVPFSKTLTHMI